MQRGAFILAPASNWATFPCSGRAQMVVVIRAVTDEMFRYPYLLRIAGPILNPNLVVCRRHRPLPRTRARAARRAESHRPGSGHWAPVRRRERVRVFVPAVAVV